MRIFILEDDENRITLFERALAVDENHHIVTIARTCTQALAKFKPPYDLLLLDHDLGGMQMVDSTHEDTGSEFCRRLGEFSAVQDVPCDVIIHSYNQGGARNMGLELFSKGWSSIASPFGANLLKWLRELI